MAIFSSLLLFYMHLSLGFVDTLFDCWPWRVSCMRQTTFTQSGASIVFLLPDWLKLNHLRSRIECDFSDIFSGHICSIVAEIIGVTNYAASFGAKKCSENHIWSCWDDACGPWNQQISLQLRSLLRKMVAVRGQSRKWWMILSQDNFYFTYSKILVTFVVLYAFATGICQYVIWLLAVTGVMHEADDL